MSTTTTTALEIAKGELSSAASALRQARSVSTHMQRALTQRAELLNCLTHQSRPEVIEGTLDQIATAIKSAADEDRKCYCDALSRHDTASRAYMKAMLAHDMEEHKLKLRLKLKLCHEAVEAEADAGVAVKKARA